MNGMLPLITKLMLIKLDSNQKRTFPLGGLHFSQTVNEIVFEKVNPKTQKIVKIKKCICNHCGRNKSQFFIK